MGHRWPCAECRRTASGESGGRDPVSACGPRTGRVPPRAPVAQWIERLPPEQKAAGSNPVRGTAPAPPPPPTAGAPSTRRGSSEAGSTPRNSAVRIKSSALHNARAAPGPGGARRRTTHRDHHRALKESGRPRDREDPRPAEPQTTGPGGPAHRRTTHARRGPARDRQKEDPQDHHHRLHSELEPAPPTEHKTTYQATQTNQHHHNNPILTKDQNQPNPHKTQSDTRCRCVRAGVWDDGSVMALHGCGGG